MLPNDLQRSVEILPERLYWVSTRSTPRSTQNTYFFCIDDEFVYEPFFADFGPLHLGLVHSFCDRLSNILKDPHHRNRRIVQYTSEDPHKRANAAFLMASFLVCRLDFAPEDAFSSFQNIYPPFLPYRDSTYGICTFHCTILDCLRGLHCSMLLNWYVIPQFDSNDFVSHSNMDGPDISWIIPGLLLAMASPSESGLSDSGIPLHPPHSYIPLFKTLNVGYVVRLNEPKYNSDIFTSAGIPTVDLHFPDGACPPREILIEFLDLVDLAADEGTVVAVHCLAGLGRTGTLIGAWAIKEFGFSGRSWIGWNRMARPGSILGPQQEFLSEMEAHLWDVGNKQRIEENRKPWDAETACAGRILGLGFTKGGGKNAETGYGHDLQLLPSEQLKRNNVRAKTSVEKYLQQQHSGRAYFQQSQPARGGLLSAIVASSNNLNSTPKIPNYAASYVTNTNSSHFNYPTTLSNLNNIASSAVTQSNLNPNFLYHNNSIVNLPNNSIVNKTTSIGFAAEVRKIDKSCRDMQRIFTGEEVIVNNPSSKSF